MTNLGAWDVAVLIAKALTYAATFGAAGAVFFSAYCHRLIAAPEAQRIRMLIGTLLAVSALASAAKVLATASSMSGDFKGMFDLGLERMVWQTGEGRALVIRLLGLAFMLPAALRARPSAWAVSGSLAAATSFAWVGHVHALAAPRLPAVVLAVHLLAAAFWLGALAPLLVVSRGADVSRVAAGASRFGSAALYVVGVLLAAGIFLLCVLLRNFAELWASGYGRLILLKLVLVAGLLGLAAFNHLRLTPRLRAHDAGAQTLLRRSIGLELAMGAMILIVTAAMTTLTGPP